MKGKEYENRTVSFAMSSKGEKMKVENISYRVDHRILFDNISFDTSSSDVTLITGKMVQESQLYYSRLKLE